MSTIQTCDLVAFLCRYLFGKIQSILREIPSLYYKLNLQWRELFTWIYHLVMILQKQVLAFSLSPKLQCGIQDYIKVFCSKE